jgi:magnesium-transporting ATPase (P-type)
LASLLQFLLLQPRLLLLLLQVGWPELPPGIASWLVQVVRFIILMAQAVPISLYVSLETVKVAQCKVSR